MTQDKTKKLINELTNVESIKVVNIALELNKLQDQTTSQLIELVGTMDKNMKLLATKVLELEKICARYQMTVGADEKRKS